jgi:YD repeat-containing protein
MPQRVKRAIRFLRDPNNKDKSIKDIARHVQLSVSWLNHLFRKLRGETIRQHLKYLVTQTTDPNSLSTAFNYDNSGRRTQTTLPTNATSTTTYSDSSQTVTASASYTSGGSNISASSSQVVDDGRGPRSR